MIIGPERCIHVLMCLCDTGYLARSRHMRCSSARVQWRNLSIKSHGTSKQRRIVVTLIARSPCP